VKKLIAQLLYTCRRFAADDDPTRFSWDWRPRLLLVAATRLKKSTGLLAGKPEQKPSHTNGH